ncbi:MAG: aminopeptidase [Lachnospiraceae bacterium]|nr:aminopeptidase [Lachnospiraceae bacterium]
MERKNVWNSYDEAQLNALESLAKDYRAFLDVGKTERECVTEAVRLAEAAGYRDLDDVIAAGETLQAGDKVYAVNMKKTLALFIVGRENMEKGMRILGAHIDSPRLDLKQNPLYEDTEMALLDTHYYGGIKKYQWVTVPLALHGVVAKKDGSVVEIVIGEKEDEPVVCISDLLVHLSGKQMEKKASQVIEGDDLNVLVGSRPLKGKEGEELKDAVAAYVMDVLHRQYGVEEEDFLSAEIEVVPAGKARDCGLDRSMVLAYGQDDRVCAYTSLAAILNTAPQDKTCCCLLVDKEEIGSVGATGMQSAFFENTVAELMNCLGCYSELSLRRALRNSKMLSSDVSAAFDPDFASFFEKKNAAYFGRGLVFNKYTGSRGKSGSNDANAEYIAELRRIFDGHGVAFQTAELGKVDVGGGGTIAYISALYGMDVIDSGVALLSMHAPMEVASKADIYEAKKGYEAFLKEA